MSRNFQISLVLLALFILWEFQFSGNVRQDEQIASERAPTVLLKIDGSSMQCLGSIYCRKDCNEEYKELRKKCHNFDGLISKSFSEGTDFVLDLPSGKTYLERIDYSFKNLLELPSSCTAMTIKDVEANTVLVPPMTPSPKTAEGSIPVRQPVGSKIAFNLGAPGCINFIVGLTAWGNSTQ